MTKRVDDLITSFREMTVGELHEFRKEFMEVFDVVDIQLPAPIEVRGDVVEDEVQTEFDVVLEAAGANRIAVIKTVREVIRGLGLSDAKNMVNDAPVTIMRKVDRGQADEVCRELERVGATITIA